MPRPSISLGSGGLARKVAALAAGKGLVSFDVFDTLLLRRAHPGVAQEASVVRMAELTGTTVESARAARQRARASSCCSTVTRGGDHECGIDAWYGSWARLASDGDPRAMAIAERVVADEVEMEAAACCLDPDALGAVRAAKATGARVVAISDMYLSASHIARLLGPAAAELDGIYTSGDQGLLKRTGQLFRLVREREGVPASRHLHVGDDPIADALRPAMQGIATLLLRDRPQVSARIERDARHRLSCAGPIAAGRAAVDYALARPSQLDDAEAIGMGTFGPILVPFVHSVVERCRAEGVERVFFLAREGLVLKAVYDLLAGAGSPPSSYLCVSRYTSLLAQMREFGPVEREVMAANMASHTPRRLLEILDLNPGELAESCDAQGLGPDEPIAPEDARFRAACASEPVRSAAAAAGVAMRSGLLAHLRETGFLDRGKVAVIDVGWGGQIQENLANLGRDVPGFPRMVGMYFGLNERAARRIEAGHAMSGLVAERWSADWTGSAIFDFVMALEAATRAPHGTTLGYAGDGTPDFADDGHPGRREEAAGDPVLCGIQRGVVRFAERYAAFARWTGLPAAATLPISRAVTARLVRFPTDGERRVFDGLVNVSNLGSSEVLPYINRGLTWSRPADALRRARWSLWQEGAAGILLGTAGQALFQGAKAFLQPPGPRPRAPIPPPRDGWAAPGADAPLPATAHPGNDAMHACLWRIVEDAPPSSPRLLRRLELRTGDRALAAGWLAHAAGAILRRRRPMPLSRPAALPLRTSTRARIGAMMDLTLLGQGIRVVARVAKMRATL